MLTLDPLEFWKSVDTEQSSAWPVVCVDLDGVLNVPSDWNGTVEHYPVAEGAVNFLLNLRDHYNTVVVFTATLPLEFAAAWLEQNGMLDMVDFLSNHKVPAQAYIDDKAVCHYGDFNDTLHRAINHVPHWKKQRMLNRPEDVEHWMKTWESYPRNKMWNLTEFTLLDYIKSLEHRLLELETNHDMEQCV